MSKDLRLFLSQILTRPHQVVAIAPSSEALCAEMARGLDPEGGAVIELGAGTGNITRAILAAGIAPEAIHSIEMNPVFCDHLRARHPKVNVHEMSACDVADLGLRNVQAVISGLPLLSMPEAVQRAIVAGSFACLAPNEPYVQFTYGPMPPILSSLRRDLGLTWDQSGVVWKNLPPARVYRFRQSLH